MAHATRLAAATRGSTTRAAVVDNHPGAMKAAPVRAGRPAYRISAFPPENLVKIQAVPEVNLPETRSRGKRRDYVPAGPEGSSGKPRSLTEAG
jgi:hypothetical protein